MKLFNWIKTNLRNARLNNIESINKDSFVQAVKYFRSLGFFQDFSPLSDENLTALLQNLHKEEKGEVLTSQNPLADLLLLKWDESRIWWVDTEADVCSGRTVYAKVLKEWGKISRGIFEPLNIQEYWASEEGPITITLIHENQEISLYPEYQDDYIDVRLLSQINKLIRKSGMEFMLYEAFDQTAFIIVLTQKEKRRLIKDRNWRFAKL